MLFSSYPYATGHGCGSSRIRQSSRPAWSAGHSCCTRVIQGHFVGLSKQLRHTACPCLQPFTLSMYSLAYFLYRGSPHLLIYIHMYYSVALTSVFGSRVVQCDDIVSASRQHHGRCSTKWTSTHHVCRLDGRRWTPSRCLVRHGIGDGGALVSAGHHGLDDSEPDGPTSTQAAGSTRWQEGVPSHQ